MGILCDVVAPGLIPVRVGDRVKTDRRLLRSGILTREDACCGLVERCESECVLRVDGLVVGIVSWSPGSGDTERTEHNAQ
jgi:hypothetical protein